ncbi:MAG: hypothetical protein KTR32_28825, partial [Granulosicoccus sp.]|nr:hypothetical protein [Granulosicoccus sp.]
IYAETLNRECIAREWNQLLYSVEHSGSTDTSDHPQSFRRQIHLFQQFETQRALGGLSVVP